MILRIVRLALLAALAILLAVSAHAQSIPMTAITATTLHSAAGPTNGTLCFRAVNLQKSYITVSAGGAMYLANTPFCGTLAAGALTAALNVPNPLTDSAPGHGYDVQVYNTDSGTMTRLGAIYGIGGSAWSLDTWVPSVTVPTAAAFTFTTGSGSAPTSCTAPALDIRINAGIVTESVCSGGAFITVTSGALSGVIGSSDVVGQTASQSTVNLVTSAPATGRYRISYYADQNALCTAGAASVWFTFGWTDATRSRSVNSVALQLGAGTSPASSIQGSLLVFVASGSAITYISTVTGACASGGPSSYDAHLAVEAVQ